MRAVVFRNEIARQAFAKAAGALRPEAFVSGLSPSRLEDVPEPPCPAPGWVRCETIQAGICGSDAKQVFLNGARDNPLTALLSFPHVLGHECVARRSDTGEVVVLDPWLGCVPRGIDPPCPGCAAGRPYACRNFRRGHLPPAIHLGNCAAAPGAHAERFWAHPSQLHPVPEGVSLDQAVLADPVSVSLHSILKRPPTPGRPALVYGCGALGLAAVGLLAHLWPDVPVWAVANATRAGELAARLGAAAVLPHEPDRLVAEVARRLGAEALEPWSGHPWLQDGPAVVYDTVGSPETVETALRLVATGGSIVVSGVEPPGRFEWTPLYFKEVDVVGSNAFGVEVLRGVRKHAFEHYFDLVREGLDLTPMITHRFPLERWGDAIVAIANRPRTGAVKVLLEVSRQGV